MSKYLKYLFKSHKNLALAVIIFNIAFVIPAILQHNDETVLNTLFTNLIVYGSWLCLVLPILLLKFIYSRSGNDTYLSLPISRKEIITSTLTYSYLLVVIPYIVLMIIGFILNKINFFSGSVSSINFILILLVTIIAFLAILIFTTGTYLIANNMFDGVVVTLAYYFLPVVIFAVIGSYEVNMIPGLQSSTFALKAFNTSIIYCLGRDLYFLLEQGTINNTEIFKLIICALVYMGIGMVSIKYNFIERKSERAENISKNIFAYPVIITVYVVLVLLMVSAYFNTMQKDELLILILLYVVIFVIYSIATFIYQRKVKFKLSRIIVFLIAVVCSIAISKISWNTHFFTLGDNLDTTNYPVRYQYYDYDSEIGFEVTINNKDDLEEVTEILNKYRKQAIKDYYDLNDEYNGASLIIDEGIDTNNNYKKEYYYGNYQILSDEELEEIGEYVVVE